MVFGDPLLFGRTAGAHDAQHQKRRAARTAQHVTAAIKPMRSCGQLGRSQPSGSKSVLVFCVLWGFLSFCFSLVRVPRLAVSRVHTVLRLTSRNLSATGSPIFQGPGPPRAARRAGGAMTLALAVFAMAATAEGAWYDGIPSVRVFGPADAELAQGAWGWTIRETGTKQG